MRRRAQSMPGAIGITFAGAVLPGVGYLWTRRVVLGLLGLLPALALLGAGIWYVGHDLRSATDFAFDPHRLRVATYLLAGAVGPWLVIVVSTYLFVRPEDTTRVQNVLGGVFVAVLCLALATPMVVGARYAWVQADLVETVFEDNQSATAPREAPSEVIRWDPWAGRESVNVLLLGGDGNVHRDGVRTDSVILASIDTDSGRTVLFSLPRNMMDAQFPPDSPFHKLYPHGYTGDGDPANYMLNAIYGQVPARHPAVLGRSDNEGADALKEAVAGSLGVDVDYYVLVNLLGFQKLVDAMGGVTVDINERVPIGGNTDLGIPPESYLHPGPHQRLNGFQALWYSRGRYGSNDYERMERQRCMVNAIIDEADPWTLLRRYQRLAATGKEIVRTDIPSHLMPAFVELATRVKDAPVRSVVFRSSDRFSPADPNFDWMRSRVDTALSPPEHTLSDRTSRPSAGGDRSATAGAATDPADACAYRAGPGAAR